MRTIEIIQELRETSFIVQWIKIARGFALVDAIKCNDAMRKQVTLVSHLTVITLTSVDVDFYEQSARVALYICEHLARGNFSRDFSTLMRKISFAKITRASRPQISQVYCLSSVDLREVFV